MSSRNINFQGEKKVLSGYLLAIEDGTIAKEQIPCISRGWGATIAKEQIPCISGGGGGGAGGFKMGLNNILVPRSLYMYICAYTVESRYLELACFELPLISK